MRGTRKRWRRRIYERDEEEVAEEDICTTC